MGYLTLPFTQPYYSISTDKVKGKTHFLVWAFGTQKSVYHNGEQRLPSGQRALRMEGSRSGKLSGEAASEG